MGANVVREYLNDVGQDQNSDGQQSRDPTARNFEIEANKRCLTPIRASAEQTSSEIGQRLNQLSRTEYDDLTKLINAWDQAKQTYEAAEDAGTKADHYHGGDLDESASDEEKRRKDLTYEEFEAKKQSWRDALNPYEEATNKLLTQYKTMPNTRHVIEYLENAVLKKLSNTNEGLKELFRDTLPYMKQDWEYEVQQRRLRAVALLGLPPWVGYWPLGQGGYGVASLWVKYDDNFAITERIVVKDSRFEAPEKQDSWTDINLWTPGGPQTGTPTEAQAMYNLRGLHGSNNVVKIKGYRIDREAMMHRIIMEFCPFGDPHTLIKDDTIYGNAPRFADGGHYDTDNSEQCTFIPEPFIWYIFESMVRAGLLMERGELEVGMKAWLPIVHRDMKLDNVLLGPTGGRIYPGYPEPKLADFGTCVTAPTGDPTAITQRGTYGIRAPEQFHMQHNEAVIPLSTKTNVWGVGMIVYSLLACENGLQEKLGDGSNLSPNDFEAPLDASAKSHYSQKLQDLMWSCLRYNPDDRATFMSLYKDIQDYTSGARRHFAQDVRTARGLVSQYQVRFRTTDIKWAIGSDIRQAPRAATGGPIQQPPRAPGPGGDDPGVDPGTGFPGGTNRKRQGPPPKPKVIKRMQCEHIIPARGKGKKKVKEHRCTSLGRKYTVGYRCGTHKPAGEEPSASDFESDDDDDNDGNGGQEDNTRPEDGDQTGAPSTSGTGPPQTQPQTQPDGSGRGPWTCAGKKKGTEQNCKLKVKPGETHCHHHKKQQTATAGQSNTGAATTTQAPPQAAASGTGTRTCAGKRPNNQNCKLKAKKGDTHCRHHQNQKPVQQEDQQEGQQGDQQEDQQEDQQGNQQEEQEEEQQEDA